MNAQELEQTKTRKFLCGLNEGYAGSRHYSWEQEYFNDLHFPFGQGWIGPINAAKLLRVLAKSLNVPIPRVTSLERMNGVASTAYMDGFIAFHFSMFTLGSIVHEFCHWYLWHKYKCVYHHDTRLMKRFQAGLTLLVGTHYLNGDFHQAYVDSLRTIGGEAGTLEQTEEEDYD